MRAQRESWILLLIGILSCFTETRTQTDDILPHSFNVTIVNRYGKHIRIITTHPNPIDKQFTISPGKSYQIISTHSSNVTMYITAYDETTFAPVTINGQRSQVVIASDKPVSYVFFVPTAPTDATVSTEEPYRPPDTKSDDITTVSPTDPALATQRSTNHAVTKTIAPTEGLTTQDPTERAVTTKNQTDDAVLRKASTKDITTEDPTDSVVGTKNATYNPVITKASTDGRTTENPTQPVVASTKLSEDAVVTKADHPTDVVASKQGPINNGVLTKVSIGETTKNPTTTGDSAVADGGDAVGGCRNDKMLIAVIIALAIFLAVVSVVVIALFCRVLKTKTKRKNDTIYSVAQKNEIYTIL